VILHKGNMWDCFGKVDLFLITTNPVVKKNGACVMGRGIAKEMSEKYPEIPFALGSIIQTRRGTKAWRDSDTIGCLDKQIVGYFMVKDHWLEPAKLSIIESSVRALLVQLDYCTQYKSDFTVALNFPGIGNGKLKREDVLPLLEVLPDNVHVWEFL